MPHDRYNKTQYTQMFKTAVGLTGWLRFWEQERCIELRDSAQIRNTYINAMLASSWNWISLQSAGDSENIGMINVLFST